MSTLAPLLEIQELDLASDAARQRSEQLPERETLPLLATALLAIDQSLATAEAEQTSMEGEEERLGLEVSQVAREIEAAEVERYSGKRMGRDEALAHDESQHALRERKESLEVSELELLEALEQVEHRIQDEKSKRAAHLAEADRVREAIQKVESEVGSEIEKLDAARLEIVATIPAEALSAYDRVRAQPRAGGRGAAPLDEGRCGACRIKLPSHEKTKMLALPEDSVIQCPQCRRLLIR